MRNDNPAITELAADELACVTGGGAVLTKISGAKPAPPPKKTGIKDLPPQVRHKIYKEVPEDGPVALFANKGDPVAKDTLAKRYPDLEADQVQAGLDGYRNLGWG
jgi:hypothetical protein